ncbi:MAG: hypothetical protein ACFCU4_00790 [Puniceicoccaceae bacterium]
MAGSESGLNERLSSAINDPQLSERWLEALSLIGEGFLPRLIERIDDSPFSPKDWIGAVIRVVDWRRDRGLPIRGDQILGYLECCVAAIESKVVRLSLDETVEEMLSEFGMVDLAGEKT